MSYSGASAPDPYTFPEYITAAGGYVEGYRNAHGRIPANEPLDPTKNNLVIAIVGQSLLTNSVNDTYNPANAAAVQNFNVYDGCIYRAVYPMLGCSCAYANPAIMGNPLLRLGDKLIGGGADRVIFAPISAGGSCIADWQVGGILNVRIPILLKRLAARGLPLHAVIQSQGEQDVPNMTSEASYTASLASMISTWRANGYDGPIFINKESGAAGEPYAPVTNAQQASWNSANGVYAGADFDAITEPGRADHVHFNAVGSDLAAGQLREALHAYGTPF